MNPQLTKELRPLLLPWLVAAAALVLQSLSSDFLFGITGFIFCGTAVLLVAMTVGAEFQQKTLWLVLTQPCDRARSWKTKLFAAAIALGSLALLAVLGILVLSCVGSPADHANSDQGNPTLIILTLTFLIATLCSAGFWTLVAQSTIGGIAFTVAIQFGITLAVQVIVSRLFQIPIGSDDPRIVASTALVGLIYSATFLWLGRRKWVNLELRQTNPGESASALPGKLGSISWFRPRPRGVTFNLLRKELHLQRSLILLALLFVGCWSVTGIAAFLLPGRNIEDLFQGLYLFYSPICMLLAGSISVSEETTLGTFPWHLSLPIGPGRQWFVKLIAGLAAGLVLAVTLPAALAWITSHLPPLETHFFKDLAGHIFVVGGCVALYLLAFWSATLLPGAVRATMTAIASLASLIGLYAFGMHAAEGLMFPGPWIPNVLLGWFQASETPMAFTVDQRFWVVFTIVLLALVILWQSALEFRRPGPKRFAFCKRAFVVGSLAIVLPIITTGLANSLKAAFSGMVVELNGTAKLLVERGTNSPNNGVSLSDMKETGFLSPETQYWLRNCTFECSQLSALIPVIITNTDSRFLARYGLASPVSSATYSLTVTFPGKKTLTTFFRATPRRSPAPEVQR